MSASDPAGSTTPLLSVVIVIASDTTRPRADTRALAACLEAFERQTGAPELELIVPVHDAVDGLEDLARRFPRVVFVRVDGPKGPSWTGDRVHHHTLRSRGLLAARGDLLALAEDHARPDADWCANVVAAHRESPCAAIGGAIENGIDRPLNWAVYLCDFARYQNPLPEGRSTLASDINVAYTRAALESVKPCWEAGFYEVRVNGALIDRGEELRLRRDVVMRQQREGLRLGPALAERFMWGRSYAQVRSEGWGTPKRLAYAALSGLLPLLLTARIGVLAWRRGRAAAFARALPLVLLLECAWSLGEGAGYVRGGPPPGDVSS